MSGYLLVSSTTFAFPGREVQVPNNVWNCGLCHVSSGGGGARTNFGEDVKEYGTEAGNVNWASMCELDSDGDSFTNGQELGDPECTWLFGDTNPAAMVTNPVDPESYPIEETAGEMMPTAGEMMPNAGGLIQQLREASDDDGCQSSTQRFPFILLSLILLIYLLKRTRYPNY